MSPSRRLVIGFGAKQFFGQLKGRVCFWVLDRLVIDDLGDQRLLTSGVKVPMAPAIPRLLRTAEVPIIG